MMQVFFNSDGTSVTAIITIVVNGVHTNPDSWPITNDPAIVLSTHPSATKTVTAIDTGVFKVVWTGLSPALTHGETFFVAIDGLLSTVAWTTWQMPFQCVLLPSTVTALALVATDTGTTIPALINTLGANSIGTVTRATDDQTPLSFVWPVTGAATALGTNSLVSIDDGATFAAITGAITELGLIDGKYWYQIAFNGADRPAAQGVSWFRILDGTYTKFFNLTIPSTAIEATSQSILTDTTIIKTTANVPKEAF